MYILKRSFYMNREDIKEVLIDVVTTFFQVDAKDLENIIIDDDTILNDGEFGLDSLSLINIIVEIERRFSIEIDDEYLSMDFLYSINSMADFVEEMLKRKNE